MTEPMCGSQTSFPTYDLPFSARTTHPSELNRLMLEIWMKERLPMATHASAPLLSWPNNECQNLALLVAIADL